MYADFEPLDTCKPSLEKRYTKQHQKHEPSSFCYYIKSFNEKVYKSKKVSYTGEDDSQKLVEMLCEDMKDIANIPNKEMIFGEEKDRYTKASKCWICGERGFTTKNFKVRDHCHVTGRFRGVTHNLCNLMYRSTKFTLVLFRNLSGYDAHLFIKKLGGIEGNIDCIPNTDEKYISITKNVCVGNYTNKDGETKLIYHQIRFIDSFKFTATSLRRSD